MYSKTAFSYASQGPFPSQSDWADLDWIDVDLTKEVSQEVAKALINENDEMKERLILNNGQEEFLKAIKHKNLQKAMANTWKKKRLLALELLSPQEWGSGEKSPIFTPLLT